MIDTTQSTPNPAADPASWTPLLTSILDEQDASTLALDAISERQAALIERSATDELLALLSERQRLLDGALASIKRIEPFTAAWDEFMGALPEDERAVFVQRVRTIQDRIDRISARDEQDRADLSRQRNALTNELASVGRSRGAIAAYAGPGRGKPNPRFQDREG